MPASALLPTTAPFADAERSALDSVLRATTPMQRHWLAGFLAGLDAAPGLAAAAPVVLVPAAPPRAAAPLTIVYATESGNSERLANAAAAAARKKGFRPKLIDMADLDVAALKGTPDLLMIAATWGEGEPPGRSAHAYAALMGDAAPRLEGTRFSVLALGDTSYAGFCTIGKELDARLEALGGVRAAPRIDCDLDYAVPAKAWIDASLLALAPVTVDPVADNVVAFARAAPAEDAADASVEPSREPFDAEVIEHHDLTSSRSSKRTVHLALDLGVGAPAYEPGDSLELFPANDAAMVEAVLAAARLTPDDAFAAKLTAERDITTLSVPTIERYAARAANHDLTAIIDGGRAREWAEGRQLVDLLETFPADLDADALISLTRPLPPRAYSIASSRADVGDSEAHLVVAETRYATHGRPRNGVASGWIANHLKPGTSLKARLRVNRHFRLPANPATDIVMIGPGTGVAPFRAFVQERAATGATGRNWLFFGDRRFNQDFLYQIEWQAALADGSLTRLDLAFSRDQPAKVYVQHRMAQRAAELVAWLEGGAIFYVCGDATHMAKDVRRALAGAYASTRGLGAEAAEAGVVGLEREKRYLTDVY